jgi:hypothetical protein
MTKYRMDVVLEFETDVNIPDFNMRGTPEEVDAAMASIPLPGPSQERAGWTSVKISRVPVATIDPY